VTDDREPVVVASAPDGVSGSMLASALESAGIPTQVRGAHAGWLYPGVHGGLGPVDVLVPRSLAADARAILATFDAGE
jgi:hypothetical protein